MVMKKCRKLYFLTRTPETEDTVLQSFDDDGRRSIFEVPYIPRTKQYFRRTEFTQHWLLLLLICVTTGPLERSSCRIHLRGRCRDEVTDVASTPAAGGCADGVPSREVHVSKKSIVFLPSSLLRSRSLFWLRERRGESNAQLQDLNESDRVPAGVDSLSESWAKSTTQTEDSHWSANGRAETRRTKPDANSAR
jgi:hypothetical protein